MAALFYTFCGRIDFIEVITPQVMKDDAMLLPMQYLTGISASLVVIGVAYYLATMFRLSSANPIAVIGKYTLGIYGVQTILLERVIHSLIHVEVPQEWASFVDFCVIPAVGVGFCVLSYYVVRTTAKVRLLNLLLYGNMYKVRVQR